VLGAVVAVALGRREREPVANVGDLGGPAAIDLGGTVAPLEAVDHRPYLQGVPVSTTLDDLKRLKEEILPQVDAM
jgi:ABC-type sugar transport system substrate-binding protein